MNPQISQMTPNGKAGAGKIVSGAAAGAGITAVLMSLLGDRPEVIEGVIGSLTSWGPGVLILGVIAWGAQRFAPPLIESQQAMARSVGELAGAVQANLNRDDDVRAAVRTLADKIERNNQATKDLHDDLRKHLAGGR